MKHVLWVVLAVTGALVEPQHVADYKPPPRVPIPREVFDYSTLLAQLGTPGAPSLTVESVFEAGWRARDALTSDEPDGVDTVINKLTKADLQSVAEKMQGFTVTPIVDAVDDEKALLPDPAFFKNLARAHPDPASLAFFPMYEDAQPNDPWPVYVQGQTDYTGCTRYGSLILVDQFGRWTAYRERFPEHYRKWVDDYVARMSSELTRGDCACGSKQTVEKELREFLRRFPTSSIAKGVRSHLRDIEGGDSGFRFNC